MCPTAVSGVACRGYELTTDLDFDTDGDGRTWMADRRRRQRRRWRPIPQQRPGLGADRRHDGHSVELLRRRLPRQRLRREEPLRRPRSGRRRLRGPLRRGGRRADRLPGPRRRLCAGSVRRRAGGLFQRQRGGLLFDRKGRSEGRPARQRRRADRHLRLLGRCRREHRGVLLHRSRGSPRTRPAGWSAALRTRGRRPSTAAGRQALSPAQRRASAAWPAPSRTTRRGPRPATTTRTPPARRRASAAPARARPICSGPPTTPASTRTGMWTWTATAVWTTRGTSALRASTRRCSGAASIRRDSSQCRCRRTNRTSRTAKSRTCRRIGRRRRRRGCRPWRWQWARGGT